MENALSKYVLKIAFLDVGQGDTIVVSCEETHEAVVIDCADGNLVLDYLEAEGVKHLRGIVLTHLHADHYSGLVQLLTNWGNVKTILWDEIIACNIHHQAVKDIPDDADGHGKSQDSIQGNRRKKSNQWDILKWFAKNNYREHVHSIFAPNGTLPFQASFNSQIKLLHPYTLDVGTLGMNDTSIILAVEGSETTALLTGDLEPNGWNTLKKSNSYLKHDVLKWPHHGAWRDADPDLVLDDVSPSVIVISVGTEGERYNHPNLEVLQAAAKRKIRLLCTQATSSCSTNILNKRTSLLAEFEKEASNRQVKLINTKGGCPCAGTVVIELATTVHVLQPELTFHQNTIIKPFYDTHQCRV